LLRISDFGTKYEVLIKNNFCNQKMSYDEDELSGGGFKMHDDDSDEPLDLDDEVGSFKFDESLDDEDDDPEDRYH